MALLTVWERTIWYDSLNTNDRYEQKNSYGYILHKHKQ